MMGAHAFRRCSESGWYVFDRTGTAHWIRRDGILTRCGLWLNEKDFPESWTLIQDHDGSHGYCLTCDRHVMAGNRPFGNPVRPAAGGGEMPTLNLSEIVSGDLINPYARLIAAVVGPLILLSWGRRLWWRQATTDWL